MIYDYAKGLEQAKENVERSSITSKNKQMILAFYDDLVVEGLSKPRLIRYLQVLKILASKLGKEFDTATISDIKRIVGEIQQSNYSYWTKMCYKVMIRRLYKWIHKSKNFPEIVDWISIRVSRSERNLPAEGDLLVEKDIQNLLSVAEHPRDKAFISMLWESGCRVGELGNLRIKDVVFDKHGTVITVKGKTGSRKIRLINSTPHISTWLNCHPSKRKDDSVWINIGSTNHNQPMQYRNIVRLIRSIFDKAEIKKKCNPHLFRHSRATFMANHLTEFQMNQYFGWIQGSDMPSTYVHMSGREVDNAVLKMNGMQTNESHQAVEIKPIQCPRCDTINSHDALHCMKCGGVLDLKHAMEIEDRMRQRSEVDELMNKLMKDREIRYLLTEKLRGLDS